ncbi:hypothetical protein [Spirochaeta dissipatitropha]
MKESENYEQEITRITHEHLRKLVEETGEAFVQACPGQIPASDIFAGMQNAYSLDAIHRLTVFFVALFNGEKDDGAVSVTEEEFLALGWLCDQAYFSQIPEASAIQDLYIALKKAGPLPGTN